jgi:hypothetical protein
MPTIFNQSPGTFKIRLGLNPSWDKMPALPKARTNPKPDGDSIVHCCFLFVGYYS